MSRCEERERKGDVNNIQKDNVNMLDFIIWLASRDQLEEAFRLLRELEPKTDRFNDPDEETEAALAEVHELYVSYADSFDSSIRFPRKKDASVGYEDVLRRPKFQFDERAVRVFLDELNRRAVFTDAGTINETIPDPKDL